MKNFVTFDADFPDDSKYTEAGDQIVPRGRALAEAIATGMSKELSGCSTPEQYSFYGWALHIDVGARFRCVIQYVEPWLLICDHLPTIGDKLLGRAHEPEFRRVLGALAAVLSHDAKFRSVKWFTREEYESSREARGKRKP